MRDFSSIHYKTDSKMEDYLIQNGYQKVTYYYDKKTQAEGQWDLYPQIQIDANLALVNVSEVPEFTEYNYVIVLDTKQWKTIEVLGPFHDSYPKSAEVIKRQNGYSINLLIENPPDDNERTYIYRHIINN